MRVRESRSLLWYGVVFFGLMTIVCVMWLIQNPVSKESNNTSTPIEGAVLYDNIF